MYVCSYAHTYTYMHLRIHVHEFTYTECGICELGALSAEGNGAKTWSFRIFLPSMNATRGHTHTHKHCKNGTCDNCTHDGVALLRFC